MATAQVDSATLPKTESQIIDTIKPVKPKPVVKKKLIVPPPVDTIARRDAIIRRDTTLQAGSVQSGLPAGWPYAPIMYSVFSKHPFYKINEPPINKQILRRVVENKDWAFYLFAVLLPFSEWLDSTIHFHTLPIFFLYQPPLFVV